MEGVDSVTVCVIFRMDDILDSSGQGRIRFRGNAGLGNMPCVLIHHEDFMRKAAKDSAGKFLRVKGNGFTGSSRGRCG
jgi:hypothetical protein